MVPEYVTEQLDIYRPPCILRSAIELRLREQRENLKSDGGRSFSIVTSKLFNSLPNDLRETTTLTKTFKSKLKTQISQILSRFYVDSSCKAQMSFFMRESGL